MTHTLNAKIGDDLYADIQAIADEDYPDPKRRGLGNVSEVTRLSLEAFRDQWLAMNDITLDELRDRHPRHAEASRGAVDPRSKAERRSG